MVRKGRKHTPPPGSARAQIQGCTCARPANGTPQLFWSRLADEKCPLHFVKKPKSLFKTKKFATLQGYPPPISWGNEASEPVMVGEPLDFSGPPVSVTWPDVASETEEQYKAFNASVEKLTQSITGMKFKAKTIGT